MGSGQRAAGSGQQQRALRCSTHVGLVRPLAAVTPEREVLLLPSLLEVLHPDLPQHTAHTISTTPRAPPPAHRLLSHVTPPSVF